MYVLAAVCCASCNAPREPYLVTHPDPSVKIPAMKLAVEARDMDAVEQLVADLESDDPAVRFYAIDALNRLTGQTFGYQYFVAEERRVEAVDKWKAWFKGWQAGQRQTTSN
jgi:hypothetical protein